MDPTDNMRKHFEPDGSPILPEPATQFCAHCKAGPLFSWEKYTYAGEVVCRICWQTDNTADADNS